MGAGVALALTAPALALLKSQHTVALAGSGPDAVEVPRAVGCVGAAGLPPPPQATDASATRSRRIVGGRFVNIERPPDGLRFWHARPSSASSW